jgi:starch synthase
MDIVFVASEMVPFAKTGGLADVIGSLPREIAKRGHRVFVFLPKYKEITKQRFSLTTSLENMVVPIGTEQERTKIYSCSFQELTIFFVHHPDYFERDHIYGTPMGDYPDNDRRFTLFQRAVLETLKKLRIKPDIIHAHDWQTGFIPAYLKTIYRSDPFFQKTKTIFTVHNLAYQGNFPPDSLPMTGFSWDEFRYERLEFYGKISFLKAGLVYSDVITTVSERYASEIQTKEFGAGLEKTLEHRKKDLHGIVNGIDPDDWDPARDSELAANFTKKDLSGKRICKQRLQERHNLKVDPQAPLLGSVGRLVSQKGLDLLIEITEDIMKKGWQLVLLGTGEEKIHSALKILARRHRDQLAVNVTFDDELARQIYSGSDMFLMPSQFEPCGLGQLISLRFGTVPIVREVGGLADTICEFDPTTGCGNGFVFSSYRSKNFLKAMERAVAIFDDKKTWNKLMRNCMDSDYSWKASARRYISIYERAQRKPLKV